jgi:2-methylisoborneol synthase
MASPVSPRSSPTATQELAALANALLSDKRTAPSSVLSELFSAAEPEIPKATTVQESATRKTPPRALGFDSDPTGLGTSAARVTSAVRQPPAAEAQLTTNTLLARLIAPSGLGTSGLIRPAPFAPSAPVVPASGNDDAEIPELFCPGPVRDDPALGELVNEQTVRWAEEVGIYPGRLDHLRAANFGRLIMLAHPSTDDPDRLLAATKMVVAEWASDDYYLDEEEVGADPVTAAARFALIYGVVDPVALPARYASQLDTFIEEEPIARAYRSAMTHLAKYTTVDQMARFQHQMAILYTTLDQNASWRVSKQRPKIWEYLLHREHNSYLPPMILIDPVAGYELAAAEFYHPRVRRPILMVGLAAVLLNDLNSAGKESDDDYSLPGLLVAEEGCTPKQALKRTVEIHNELMHNFVVEAAVLSLTGSPALRRFFADLWAWCGGSREWHATTRRYHPQGA